MRKLYRYLVASVCLSFSHLAIPAYQGCYADLTVDNVDVMPCSSETCEKNISILVEADHWCAEILFVTFNVTIYLKSATNSLKHVRSQWQYDITSEGPINKKEYVLLNQGDALFDVVVANRKCDCISG